MVKCCKFCKSEFEIKYKSEQGKEYCSRNCANKCPERAKKISEGRKKMLDTPEGKAMYRKAMKKRNELPYYQRRETERKRERDVIAGRSEYKSWRIAVLGRDKFTCQKCGKVGGILQAHHKKEWSKYPELRFDIDNGVTLCPDCHNDIHGFEVLSPSVCPICDNQFKPHHIKQVCCSTQCAAHKRRGETKQKWTKPCQECGNMFFGFSRRKFCSVECYHKSLATLDEKFCEFCNNQFKPRMVTQKFCSRKCYFDSKRQ